MATIRPDLGGSQIVHPQTRMLVMVRLYMLDQMGVTFGETSVERIALKDGGRAGRSSMSGGGFCRRRTTVIDG